MRDLDEDLDLAEIPDDLPHVETGCVRDEDPGADLEIWTGEFLQTYPEMVAAAAGEFAPSALARIYTLIDPQYLTMRRSGIVGDARHRRGYHRGRAVLPSSDYSVQAPADKRGSAWACCGIDISFGPREMIVATRRLMNACLNKDPRIEPLREFFGTLNGDRVTGYNRYPSANRGVGYTTSDSSHLWHVHISIFRDYAEEDAKMRGIADVLNGVPLKPPPPPPPPTPPEEKPHVITPEDKVALAKELKKQLLEDDGLKVPDEWLKGHPTDKTWPGLKFWRYTFDTVHRLERKVDAITAALKLHTDEPDEPQP